MQTLHFKEKIIKNNENSIIAIAIIIIESRIYIYLIICTIICHVCIVCTQHNVIIVHQFMKDNTIDLLRLIITYIILE